MDKRENLSFAGRAGPIKSFPVTTLQANLGRVCNLSCTHCHHAASPEAKETMPWEVMEEIIKVAEKAEITTVDITGGAPELHPQLCSFIDRLCRPGLDLMLRTNLVALVEPEQAGLAEHLKEKNVKLVASLPCYREENVTAQRGDVTFNKSIAALKKLNSLGYGKGNGLALDLVYNPGGPFLPGRQEELEAIYRRELQLDYEITFSRLLTLTNVPIGRFKDDLCKKGQLNQYLQLLRDSYNRATLSGLMCRSQISVGWDGTIYDCDFNLALSFPADVEKAHITCFDSNKHSKRTIVSGEHCFSCTAGAGSSCAGALEAGE